MCNIMKHYNEIKQTTTIHELLEEKMRTIAILPADSEPCGFTDMTSSIQDHFGDSILIT